MTLEELAVKYDGARVNEDRLNAVFRNMGKFGPMFIYTFSFDTDNATVTAEVCIKHGKMVGFTPEKTPRQDEWGYDRAEDFDEELTDEELERFDQYLGSVLA
ncbi:MAG: hypothetical protein IJ042_00565 [Butyricicoccus sp.]|nr:hypothetical protein [Butyricicoccus sp.]